MLLVSCKFEESMEVVYCLSWPVLQSSQPDAAHRARLRFVMTPQCHTYQFPLTIHPGDTVPLLASPPPSSPGTISLRQILGLWIFTPVWCSFGRILNCLSNRVQFIVCAMSPRSLQFKADDMYVLRTCFKFLSSSIMTIFLILL